MALLITTTESAELARLKAPVPALEIAAMDAVAVIPLIPTRPPDDKAFAATIAPENAVSAIVWLELVEVWILA